MEPVGESLPLFMYIAFVALLIGLNAFFVAAEFAMVKVQRSRLDRLAAEGRKNARIAKSIVKHLDAYLSACQLGITLASLGLGWVGEPAVAALLKPLLLPLGLPEAAVETIAFAVAFTLITVLHITLGEQFPKTYAIRQAERVTLLASGPLLWFYKLMYPFIWLLGGMSNGLLRLAGIEPSAEHRSAHTEEEIRVLMKESNRSGLINSTELTLVDNIFDFTETHAREIMIPRTDMVCLYTQLSYEENKMIAISEMHTRYPVCDPDKDRIIGFVHIKDLLKSGEDATELTRFIRPLTHVPESMQISTLLKLMQRKKAQMALLIDEFGGTSGLVTFEDIIEEIVGDIQDEFDEERPHIERGEDGAYSIDGRLLIEEVNSFFALDIASDDYDTIGGWIYSQVDIPPKKHQRIAFGDAVEFTIEETDQLRIVRLTVRRRSQTQEAAGGEEGGSIR